MNVDILIAKPIFCIIMTLKTVLRNFLNFVEATEARRQSGEDLFEIEFQVNGPRFECIMHGCLAL